MYLSTAHYPTFVNAALPMRGLAWRNILLAVFGSALLAMSAKIQVPFYPVPMTMQTFAVLVIGAAYGWRLGAATVLLYLAEGAYGLPVFAGTPEKGIGLAYMAGPTGGYLVGFVLGAALTGWLAERGFDRNVVKMAAAMIAGHMVLFVPGLIWLSNWTGTGAPLWAAGLSPFIYATLFKTALAAALMPAAWALLGRRGRV